ncbi:MAG: hypothetical protein AAF688_02115 [Bacteroidota bacterium]
MPVIKKLGQSLFKFFLSNNSREYIERSILTIALVGFLMHLCLIGLVRYDVITFLSESELLQNPISAIYTPFSFILIYEVYALIFYLPYSFTTYITKQYEIITLIIIRRLFKDLASLELTSNWFEIKDDLQFTYDLIASLVLFYLIYLFIKHGKRKMLSEKETSDDVKQFINVKKAIAVVLVPLFFFMALFTFFGWAGDLTWSSEKLPELSSINNLFFDKFFTVLIMVDVVLLLTSFFYVNEFHKIIRNSGFIISTILIRMSFSVTGLINSVLIIVAVLFGLLIILIHNNYERKLPN